MSCPLCSIPSREHLLYSDDDVYLVETQNMKGHNIRIMAATHRHTPEPSFIERVKMINLLTEYMTANCPDEWYMNDSTYASVPEHAHIVVCDTLGTESELKQLAITPKIKFPYNKTMIGIPAYNEDKHIGQVIAGARRYGDVVVYNDGSTDQTVFVALANGAMVLNEDNLLGNRGYGFGLQTLFQYAKDHGYSCLVTLDADGQHNPVDIINVLCGLHGSDMVIGNRFTGSHNAPLYRSLFIKGISYISGVGDSQSGFRGYNRRAIEAIKPIRDGMDASLEILGLAKENGLKIAEVPISVSYDADSHSMNPVAQGFGLLENLFWSYIWGKPISTLGSTSFITGILGVFFLGKVMNIWYTQNTFVSNLAIVGSGFILFSLFMLLSLMFVLVNRRLLREIKR